MDGEHDIVTVVQTLRQVGYLGGKDVGHGHLHGRREVDDGLAVRRGFPYIQDGVADFQGVFRFRTGEAFRRIFKAVIGAGFVGQALQQSGSVHGNLLDFFL